MTASGFSSAAGGQPFRSHVTCPSCAWAYVVFEDGRARVDVDRMLRRLDEAQVEADKQSSAGPIDDVKTPKGDAVAMQAAYDALDREQADWREIVELHLDRR